MWALITAISTIICSIAQLPLANTTPIPTQELVWGTLRGACNRRKEKQHITAYWWNNTDEEKNAEHFLRFVRNFSYEHKSITSSSLEFSSSSTPSLHIFMLIWRSANSLPVWVHCCFTVKFIWLVSLRMTGWSWLTSLWFQNPQPYSACAKEESVPLIIWSVTPARLWILSLPRKDHLV